MHYVYCRHVPCGWTLVLRKRCTPAGSKRLLPSETSARRLGTPETVRCPPTILAVPTRGYQPSLLVPVTQRTIINNTHTREASKR